MQLQVEAEGQIYDFEVPFSVDEITFSQYIDFKKAEQRYFGTNTEDDQDQEPDSVQTKKQTEPKDPKDPIDYLAEAVGFVVSGDLGIIPFSLPEDNDNDLFEKKYTIGIGDQLSILRLWCHIVTVINAYEPQQIDPDYSIQYEGEKYYVDPEMIFKHLENRAYTLGEVIEYKELERVIDIEQKGDQDGSIEFMMSLRQMAVLLRQKGEKLPWQKGLRDKFLRERSFHFQQMSMTTVLEVRFFLINILLRYVRKGITGFSLRDALPRGTARRKAMSRKKSAKTT